MRTLLDEPLGLDAKRVIAIGTYFTPAMLASSAIDIVAAARTQRHEELRRFLREKPWYPDVRVGAEQETVSNPDHETGVVTHATTCIVEALP